ncbi:MAG: multiple antibiotic resistance protein [Flavobacteriales bacterium]|jgi:multiple antibiotic resistance protein
MNFIGKEIIAATMILFAVIDIVGNIPIVIKLRKKAGHIQSAKASLVALAIMIAFVFVGESILSVIGVNVNEFAVAGSFILFFLALEMILGVSIFKDDDTISAKTVSVFPLAFPLLAGPGSLTSLLALRAEYHIENILVAIVINILLIFIVLKTSSRIEKFMGKNGIAIIQKVFGVILLAIAVKLFTANIQELFR